LQTWATFPRSPLFFFFARRFVFFKSGVFPFDWKRLSLQAFPFTLPNTFFSPPSSQSGPLRPWQALRLPSIALFSLVKLLMFFLVPFRPLFSFPMRNKAIRPPFSRSIHQRSLLNVVSSPFCSRYSKSCSEGCFVFKKTRTGCAFFPFSNDFPFSTALSLTRFFSLFDARQISPVFEALRPAPFCCEGGGFAFTGLVFLFFFFSSPNTVLCDSEKLELSCCLSRSRIKTPPLFLLSSCLEGSPSSFPLFPLEFLMNLSAEGTMASPHKV